MSLTAENYKHQFQALLPYGPAWPRDDDADLTRFLAALAEEFARIDARTDALLNEADPRTTLELLLDWERVVGLPDGCVGPLDGTSARRAAVVGKLNGLGGQSPAYYIALAASIGFGITITEFFLHTCESDCETPIYGELWRFVWAVTVIDEFTVIYQTCEDDCETPLASWGNDLLECTINRLKPAHTLALFYYGT